MRSGSDGGGITSNVAVVLQKLREERDWSQATLARRAGIGVATIRRIETQQINARTGKVDIPKSTTLRRIAVALGDGNTDRARDAQQKLFSAAGYSLDEGSEDDEAIREITRLRERIEALEHRIAPNSPDIERQIRALLDSYPPERRTAAITLMQRTLQRYAQDLERLPPASP